MRLHGYPRLNLRAFRHGCPLINLLECLRVLQVVFRHGCLLVSQLKCHPMRPPMHQPGFLLQYHRVSRRQLPAYCLPRFPLVYQHLFQRGFQQCYRLGCHHLYRVVFRRRLQVTFPALRQPFYQRINQVRCHPVYQVAFRRVCLLVSRPKCPLALHHLCLRGSLHRYHQLNQQMYLLSYRQ